MADNIYNPDIVGFSESEGPMLIPLQEARAKFGGLPSDFHLLSSSEGREAKKALNLSLGLAVTQQLKQDGTDLKSFVNSFFRTWHRDYLREFRLDISPFINLNAKSVVQQALGDNKAHIDMLAKTDIRRHLIDENLIRRDIINSIGDDILLDKCRDMLEKKARAAGLNGAGARFDTARSLVCAKQCMLDLTARHSISLENPGQNIFDVYADEISQCLLDMEKFIPLSNQDRLNGVRGEGVEFQYASRDASYLDLGTQIGDCSAGKACHQVEQHVENIYWTVFS